MAERRIAFHHVGKHVRFALSDLEVLRGEWIDPLAGRVTLGEYGTRWAAEHRTTQRTREEYEVSGVCTWNRSSVL